MPTYFEQRMVEIRASAPAAKELTIDARRGYIYFATAGDHVKIGFARDIDNRITSLRTGNHQDISLEESFASYFEAEKMIHRRFAKNRVRGEWFNRTSEIEELWDAISAYQEEQAKSCDGTWKSLRSNMKKVFIDLPAVEIIAIMHLTKVSTKGSVGHRRDDSHDHDPRKTHSCRHYGSLRH